MIIGILGILDIAAGLILILGDFFAGNEFLFSLAILFLLKGLYSVGTAAAAGFFFDILGWIDLISSLFLLLLLWEWSLGIFFWVGVIMALKGLYSLIIAFVMH